MRIPPPAIALGAATAQRVLTPDAPPSSAARKVGAAAVAAGAVGLVTTAQLRFRQAGTTIDPVHPDRASALVTSGPYGITRNPMYVGLAGVLLAHAVLRGSWRALPSVAAFVAVIDRWQVPAEEAAMSARFGTDYEEFRARVPRWIGLR